MAKGKNNSSSNITSKQNARAKAKLNHLIEAMKEHIKKAELNGDDNSEKAIAHLQNLQSAYHKVMEDLNSICKYPNDDVKQLKALARTFYDKADVEIRKKISDSLKEIDVILDDLKNKIGTEALQNPHWNDVSLQKADTLLEQLRNARSIYSRSLCGGISIGTANGDFKQNCELAIEKALPSLEKDLSWGAYLGNLLKSLARAMITVCTVGYIRPSSEVGMFAKSHSETFKAAKAAESELDSAAPVTNLN